MNHDEFKKIEGLLLERKGLKELYKMLRSSEFKLASMKKLIGEDSYYVATSILEKDNSFQKYAKYNLASFTAKRIESVDEQLVKLGFDTESLNMFQK